MELYTKFQGVLKVSKEHLLAVEEAFKVSKNFAFPIESFGHKGVEGEKVYIDFYGEDRRRAGYSLRRWVDRVSKVKPELEKDFEGVILEFEVEEFEPHFHLLEKYWLTLRIGEQLEVLKEEYLPLEYIAENLEYNMAEPIDTITEYGWKKIQENLERVNDVNPPRGVRLLGFNITLNELEEYAGSKTAKELAEETISGNGKVPPLVEEWFSLV